MSLSWIIRRTCRALTILLTACQTIALIGTAAAPACAQHVLGIDTSFTAWSQTQWNTLFGEGYRFAIPRAGHGLGADAGFYNNISLATNAGLLVGSYHFILPATDTATDEANFYLNTAGMYMKPGYLLPVCDLESGNSSLDTPTMRDWVNLFNDTIFNAKGVRPIVYASSSYASDEVDAQVAWNNYATTPKTSVKTYQWLARPIGSSGQTLASGNPPPAVPGYPNPYGVWDPNYITKTNSRDPAIKPWAFWQNTGSTVDASGINVDYDAVNGNIEFLKDFLVPALWTNAGSGDWSTLDANGRAAGNWNSGNLAWVSGNASTGPAPRLPNSLDWVKLQATGTVTLSSGAQSVRKFYTQQPFNITGGSLTIGYLPGSGGQFDLPSEFNAAVTLSSGAAYSAHTTQVDGGGGQFNINGGTITFSEIQLASQASNSGKIVMGGDATFGQTGGAGTSVIRSTGTLAQAGSISLSAGNRTFSVNNGSAGVDLNVRVAVTGAGGLVKSGAGTMQLSTTDSYSGGTTITSGVLQIAGDDRLGAVPAASQPTNIILNGGTLKTGSQINSVSLTNAGSNYIGFPTLTVNGAGTDSMAASVNILAGIRTIGVTAGGSGYVNQAPSSPPINGNSGTFVDIVGGGGSGATAYATVSGGVVTSITIANQGSGYTSMPSVFISGTGSTAGSGATASATGITLQSLALNDGGFDYTTPTISISGGSGSGATASATASSSNITLNGNRGVSLTANGGTLYQTAGTTLTVGGIISSTGSGTLNKSGAGTLVLNGANTYTGATAINSGVLRIGASERIPDGSAVTVAAGSTFDLQNNTETIGSLTGSGSVTNASLLITGGDNTSSSFSGAISSGALSKTGTGTMTLSGTSSYSGGTTISAGTLSGSAIPNLGTNSPFGTGSFSIANGATLEYTGFSASTNRSISLGSGGGTVSVPSNISALSLSGIIDGSALTKSGAGTLTVRGANTFAGGTTVSAGTLNVSTAAAKLGTGNVTVEGTTAGTTLAILTGVSNAIDDSAALYLMGGGNPGDPDQGYVGLSAGINELVGALVMGGVPQPTGLTYGSSSSSALIKSDEYFSGDGLVSVGLLGDFNNDHSVDAADYVAWQKNPSTFGGSSAFDLWRANFGNTSPGAGSSISGSSVPEPSSLFLLMLGLAAIAGHRRGR